MKLLTDREIEVKYKKEEMVCKRISRENGPREDGFIAWEKQFTQEYE